MKRLLLIAALTTFTFAASLAQTVDLRRKIEVSGTAEQEVTPDIIYVSISLREYIDGKNKTTIDVLERQLQKAVSDAGVPKEDFTINNLSSYNHTVQKKKNPDFLASKQYRIKFHDLNAFNQIMASVDAKGVQSTNIDSYDYSKIESLKKDLKVKALIAAKEKATYLLTALGDHLGSALDVQEVSNDVYPQPIFRTNVMMMKSASEDAAAPQDDIDVKKIKLSSQMNVTFEIVK